ncbi:MAG: hypothetical protein JWO95_8 [Verrucomicrobiales bacterium]|nr:hypothetical protein [Verrucomicrobiales bacterium]
MGKMCQCVGLTLVFGMQGASFPQDRKTVCGYKSTGPVYVCEIGILIEMLWRKPESDGKRVLKWSSERL